MVEVVVVASVVIGVVVSGFIAGAVEETGVPVADDVLDKNVYIISPFLTYITNAPLPDILVIILCPSAVVSHIPNLLLDVNKKAI